MCHVTKITKMQFQLGGKKGWTKFCNPVAALRIFRRN